MSPFYDAGFASEASTFGQSTFKLDTKELDRIMKVLGKNVEDILTAAAFEIEASAKMRAPVDTSALQNSIYTVTKKSDGYSSSKSSARSKNKNVQFERHPKPTGKVIANVGPSVDYAEPQEFGTSKMAAHPYLTPAVEDVFHKVNSGEYWKDLVK